MSVIAVLKVNFLLPADTIPFLVLLLILGSLLTSFFVVVGTAQEAVRDAARVGVTSRNHSGRVDACGCGVARATRVEGG
jgi:hypothetical protein